MKLNTPASEEKETDAKPTELVESAVNAETGSAGKEHTEIANGPSSQHI